MNQLEKINYKGWPNCYRLTNGRVDLIVTTDVGPRIIHFGFTGERNEFVEFEEMLGKTGGDEWRIYGGHRFWHAPEAVPRTYYPDNDPVVLEETAVSIKLIQPTEPTTGLQKEIEIRLDSDVARVEIRHRLTNHNLFAVTCAPWALSVMAEGGTAIVPQPPYKSHGESLLPASTIVLWPYTNMADPRWTWGNEYVLLDQDSGATPAQKAGFSSHSGWVAYAREPHLFVKTIQPQPDALYPDMNSSIELFTNADILEVETLAPLGAILPETAVVHTETWHLFPDVAQPKNEQDVTSGIMPIINAIPRP